jgi:hypothetical protein
MFRSLTSFVVQLMASLFGFILMGAYGFGIWFFLLHSDDDLPSRAGAVVALAGADDRLPLAQKLVRDGVSNTLVVSEDSAKNDPNRYALCHGPKPKGYTLICRSASPSSTRGEARMIAGLAEQRDWSNVVVVSSRYHLYRAKMLIHRCTHINVAMRGIDSDPWWRKAWSIPLEYAKLGWSVTGKRGC